jgi:hypothetical protein
MPADGSAQCKRQALPRPFFVNTIFCHNKKKHYALLDKMKEPLRGKTFTYVDDLQGAVHQ